MRALVIGGSGQVGGALLRALAARGHAATGTYAQHPADGLAPLDLRVSPAVTAAITAAAPDWVLCPAGLTHVDHCEEHPADADALNRDAPLAAARAAARAGAGFVFFSTEYVFDGEQGPYAENDPARPLSAYGRSKWEGECAVLDGVARALVIRTTVVYGPDRQEKNFVYQLIRNCRGGQGMRVPADQVSSPTYNADLADAVVELCERDARGVYHLAGDAVLDRFALARLACEVFGLDAARVTPVTTASLGQKAARPLNAGLRIEKARAVLRTPLRGPREGLQAMLLTLSGQGFGPLSPQERGQGEGPTA
jgi:dTDP-4-dehydrorhamnose reductase